MWNWQYDQDDLAGICRDRDLVTSERHPPNDYYGQASVIKRYADLPEKMPLPFIVEHGLFLDNWVWDVDARSKLSTIGASSRSRAARLRDLTDKVVSPIGFGYVYAKILVSRDHGPDPVIRQGTLVFPPHSTHHIRAAFAHDTYAAQLSALPEEFQPVVICGYWKDVLAGALRPYEKRGLQVVSCGHMYDSQFMLRLHDICRHFRYATSPSIGTHLFAAVSSRCQYFFSGPAQATYEGIHVLRDVGNKDDELFREYDSVSQALFGNKPTPILTTDQQRFVESVIGEDVKLTPVGMREFAEEAMRRQRFHAIRRRLWPLANNVRGLVTGRERTRKT